MFLQVECANGQLGYGKRKRSVPTDGSDLQRLYEVSMSTIVRFEDETEAAKPETQPENVPSARQRQEELLVEKGLSKKRFESRSTNLKFALLFAAILSNVYKRDQALLDLAKEFGDTTFQRQTFVEFEHDDDSNATGKATVTSMALLLASLFALRLFR